ncbi:SUMF1/EgtB/PvdO family nonheme iron enzyme [Rubrivivax benzoatilyticus]|nr:SUMF1/EgtB/PvdO family nonheme iron enzyme [Rubrivivax benzoatilyticus]
MKPRAAALDDAQAMRVAGAELLSLALIDARNHTLRWLAAFEARDALSRADGGPSPLALAARAGAWQDRWIARNVCRQRGEAADASALRLPPADAAIDAWLAGAAPAPTPAALRAWLAQTLETTLDLLGSAHADDAGLHVFRCALRHEDRLGEALAERAAALQLHAGGEPPLPWREPPALAAREPLRLPAQRWMLGSRPGGAVPENERWAHEVALPAFEIDARPVSWAAYAEFAEDGGYDRRECWSPAGWAWLQAEGRRAPRHVEQLRGGVLVQRHGELRRAAPAQAALHLSRHEAEAWCRWAGRRLPTEAEWECAAQQAAGRGFAWGEVFEWVAGSARPWPGHAAGASALDPLPARPAAVLRGASWMTRLRQAHPKARRFAPAEADTMFCGFRSCAI